MESSLLVLSVLLFSPFLFHFLHSFLKSPFLVQIASVILLSRHFVQGGGNSFLWESTWVQWLELHRNPFSIFDSLRGKSVHSSFEAHSMPFWSRLISLLFLHFPPCSKSASIRVLCACLKSSSERLSSFYSLPYSSCFSLLIIPSSTRPVVNAGVFLFSMAVSLLLVWAGALNGARRRSREADFVRVGSVMGLRDLVMDWTRKSEELWHSSIREEQAASQDWVKQSKWGKKEKKKEMEHWKWWANKQTNRSPDQPIER